MGSGQSCNVYANIGAASIYIPKHDKANMFIDNFKYVNRRDGRTAVCRYFRGNAAPIENFRAEMFEIMLLLLTPSFSCLYQDTTAVRKFPDLSLKSKREKQIRDKLARNRKLVKEIVLKTLMELANDGDYSTLQQGVKMLKKKSVLLVSLRSRYEDLKCTLENVTTEIQKNRQQWTIHLSNSDLKVAMLRDSIKDRVFNARIQNVYAERWLCARAEAHELQMQKETTFAPAPKLEHEDCVHNELLRAYELQIKEREDLLNYWKSRYSQDTVDIDARLNQQCEKLRITLERREELDKLYKLHEGEMRAWLTFKKERTARLGREERLRKAATRVQAWWRGVMVRRALGSFRYLRNAKKPTPKLKKK